MNPAESNHLELTIKEVAGEIAALQDLLSTLHKFNRRRQILPQFLPLDTAGVVRMTTAEKIGRLLSKPRRGKRGRKTPTPPWRERKKRMKRGSYKKRVAREVVVEQEDVAGLGRVTRIESNPPAKDSYLAPAVSTMAAAMKVMIAACGSAPFSADQIRSAVENQYRAEDFVKNATPTSAYGNLSYWAKTGKLDKTGDGAAARYKVIDKEFFAKVGE